MKQCRRMLAMVLALGLLGMSFPVNSYAAVRVKTISSVSLKVGVDIESGDTLGDIDININGDTGTFISSNSAKYYISDVEWVTSEDKKMKIGEQPKMKVTLTAYDADEYAFRGSYGSSNVKVTGGGFVTSKREGSDTLYVTVKVNGIKGTYDAPGEAYWKDSGIGMARWEEVDSGSGAYDIYLRRGSSVIKKVERLKATSYNFYPYMTKEGTYSFQVRTVPYTETQEKYGKKSDWTESDEYYLSKEKVSDGSGQNDGGPDSGTQQVGWIKDGTIWYYRYPDGSYIKNAWSKINDKWYLFDSAGVMLTGWQQKKNLWYYLNHSGDMYKGWLHNGDKWYYLNPSETTGVEGAMVTGWLAVDNKAYYMDKTTGVMVTGWREVDGNWYYFYPSDGSKAVNTTIDTFPVDADGIWHKP